MRRDPFDEVCSCDHETASHHCICVRRKDPARACCSRCHDGKHTMFEKNKPLSLNQTLNLLRR